MSNENDIWLKRLVEKYSIPTNPQKSTKKILTEEQVKRIITRN